METNATIVDESAKVQKTGEATISKKTDKPQPKQPTPIDQLQALLEQFPELTASLNKKEEPAKIKLPPSGVTKPIKKESRIFLLHGDHSKRKGDVILDMTDDVLDPVTNKTRRVRLIRGAQSIWQDEQNNLPKEHTAKNEVRLVFSRARCIIPIHETLKLQACDVSNRNMDNLNRVGHKDIYFYEWNPEKESLKDEARQNLIIQAMQIAATSQFKDLIPHAQYLGVAINDEMGIPFSESAIRTLYSKKAMNEPEKFLNSIHSPVIKTAHTVRKAVNAGLIDMGRQPNQAFWTDGGFICALPTGKDPIEYLIEFAGVMGESNERFVKQLNEMIT